MNASADNFRDWANRAWDNDRIRRPIKVAGAGATLVVAGPAVGAAAAAAAVETERRRGLESGSDS